MAVLPPVNWGTTQKSPIQKFTVANPSSIGATLKFPERWTNSQRTPIMKFGAPFPITTPNGTNEIPPRPLPGGGAGGGAGGTRGYPILG